MKLHKDTIALSERTQKLWREKLKEYGILYVYAMSGFGKTVQSMAFAQLEFKVWKRVAVSDGFFEELEQFCEENQKIRSKKLIIVDDLQWLQKPEEQQRLVEFIQQKKGKLICWILLSRANLPDYLSPFRLTKKLAVENVESLRLHAEEIAQMIHWSGLAQERPELFLPDSVEQSLLLRKCVEDTHGHGIAVTALIERLREPKIDYAAAVIQAKRDMTVFVEHNVFQPWEPRYQAAAVKLSVCEFITLPLAQCLLGEETQSLLDGMLRLGNFVMLGADGFYRIHYLFLRFLRDKLKEYPEEERKELYLRAGQYYAENRNLPQALECYRQAGDSQKLIDVICDLCENADGSTFARSCETYFDNVTPEQLEENPRLIGAKAMLLSYQMKPEESSTYLEQLRRKVGEEKHTGGKQAITAYIRTLIALPHGNAEMTYRNLPYFCELAQKNGITIKNIIPTGNMPSVINGGIDLLPWEKAAHMIYPVMKKAAESMIGAETVGIADVAMGENLYEKGQHSKAIAYLTRGLSEANFRGTPRMQYAATAVMARLFQADNQWKTADEILSNLVGRVQELQFYELVPHIKASLVLSALLKGDRKAWEEWLRSNPVDEHSKFYITDRFMLYTKAKVYIASGRQMEALHIIGLLERYAQLYGRTYMRIQLLTLKAIVFYRQEEDWQSCLMEAVKMAFAYKYIHVLADEGAALLPLWEEMEQEDLPERYTASVAKMLKRMAHYYPNYLTVPKQYGELTKKEQEVLGLMAHGSSNNDIAEQLHLSTATVKFHVGNILKKLHADNRMQAVSTAREQDLL